SESERLREDFNLPDLANQPQWGAPTSPLDDEYLSWTGPSGKQLYFSDVLDQNSKCFWAWNHDPIAHDALCLIRNFTIGRGVTVTANDPRVQKIVDDFDADENMNARVKNWTVALSRDGELFIRKIKPGDGTTKVRSLDPMTIWEVVTDAEDIETVYYFVQRYMTRTQIISPPNGESQKWIDRYLDPRDVIHAKINVSECEVRGRSDLFPVLGYLKRLRDLFSTMIVREQAQAAYIHDYAVDGGIAEVREFSASVPKTKPTPGSSFVHNKAVTISVVQPTASRATDAGTVWEGLMTIIAVGLGIAKDYLGITSRGSRATALVATAPSAMTFEERQDVITSLLRQLYADVIDEARVCGLIEGAEDFGFT
ncbi:MAG: hypothetical protein ACREQ5_33835, partial [Candidatus Dormibacteria bacterium]